MLTRCYGIHHSHHPILVNRHLTTTHSISLSLSLSMQIKKIKCEKKFKINLVGEFKRISCIGLLFTLYLMLRLF